LFTIGLSTASVKDYLTLYGKVLESSYLQNMGNGKFQLRPLPPQTQYGPLFGILAEDINNDGNLDILAVGNSYAPEVISGRMDALNGVTLLGKGDGTFDFIQSGNSGFFVSGDAKGIRDESKKPIRGRED